jgi:hypothetical protein
MSTSAYGQNCEPLDDCARAYGRSASVIVMVQCVYGRIFLDRSPERQRVARLV